MEKDSEVGYQHWCPMKKEDATWFSKLTCHLVRSLDELKEIFETHKDSKYMAFDTETDGLNADVNHIVGFSFAYSDKEGWYVPIRHMIGHNLPAKESLELFYNAMLKAFINFEYNMRFDTRMMEKEGFDLSVVKYYDVQVGVFLADTNWKKTGLKLAEKRWLGWAADTFEETLGTEANFSYLDPEDCYPYACVDAIGTFAVAQKTIQFYKEARVAGRVTNEILYPFMKCEDKKICMDLEYLRKCQVDTLEHLKTLEHEIIAEVGYPFKLNSNKQLGDALQSIGINTNTHTKGGQMKVDIASLETTNIKDPHPILEKLIDYSKSFKMYNSYICSLIKECEEHDSKLRFNFKACSAPTLRMAAGSDAKNEYFAKINVMAIPKPHPKMWYVHEYHEGDELYEGDQVVLDWRFSLTEKSEWVTESTDPVLNMRNAFLPDPGHYVVGMDYAAQELRMQANLANVKVWVETFNTGGDLHTNMAKAMWGEENYDKEKRKKAKVLNFGMLYGMSAYTLAERFHITLEEGQDIVNRYWKAVPEIQAYQKAMLRKAKKEGTTYNYFGGPRRVRYYLDSDDPRKRAFGQRTVGNNPIQSSCATMTQIAFLKVWQRLYSHPDWKDDCHFFSFIHDEILSSVSKERVLDFIKIQRECMETKYPNMPVTFTTSVAIGNAWGNPFEFKYTEDGRLVPDMERVEE